MGLSEHNKGLERAPRNALRLGPDFPRPELNPEDASSGRTWSYGRTVQTMSHIISPAGLKSHKDTPGAMNLRLQELNGESI